MPRVTDLKKKINDLESRLSAAQEEARLAINKANDNEQYYNEPNTITNNNFLEKI